MPHSAINCKRLVSKCAWSFWANAHESEAAWEQLLMKLKPNSTMDLVKHLAGPSWGSSHRIMPAQLLNRRRISSSSISISSDLQEELLTGSCQRSYWTDGGSHLHPHTSCRTYKRNFKRTSYQRSYWTDGGSHLHPYTSHRTYKRNFSGSCQRSYWTDRGSHLHPYTSHRTYKRNFSGSCQGSYWTDGESYLHPYPRNGLLDNFLSFMNHDFE